MVCKRIIDIAGAIILLAVLSPLLLVLAGLVAYNFGAPVLYYSPRTGYKGRIFQAIKFRSMPNIFGADGKLLPDGQRLTHFSHFIRSTSMDELPQLLNILKGEMSFIGPRPQLVEFTPYFKPNEMRRLDMLPGITGWAQVNGRNLISWDKRLELDAWYVDNWSLTLDFKIALKTLPVWLQMQGISTPGHATSPRLDECRMLEEKAAKPAAAPVSSALHDA